MSVFSHIAEVLTLVEILPSSLKRNPHTYIMGHKANSPIPSPSLRGGGKVGSASTCVLCFEKENPLEDSNLFSLPPRPRASSNPGRQQNRYLWQTWISGGHTGTICGSPVSSSSSSSSPPRLAQPMPRAQRGSGDPGAGASPSPAGTLGGGRGPREGRRSSLGREAG